MVKCIPEWIRVVKKDGVVAWVICLCAFISGLIILGIDNSFGIIIGSLMEHLDANVSTVSWIGSVHSCAMFLFASIASILIEDAGMRIIIIVGTAVSCLAYAASALQYNATALVFTYGILGGAGSGFLWTSIAISCAYYFEKYKALATGLALSGSTLGIVSGSLLADHINIEYGVQNYFAVLGAMSSLTFAFAFFASSTQNHETDDISETTALNPDNGRQNVPRAHSEPTNGVKQSGTNALSRLRLLKDRRLYLYCTAHMLYELSYYVPVTFLPGFMAEQVQGLSRNLDGGGGSMIISVLGFANTVGRILIGFILQYSGACPIMCSAVSLVLLALGCFGLSACSNYDEFIAVTFVYGLIMETIDIYTTLILIKMFGEDNLSATYAVVMLGKVISTVWGPPIAGALKDLTGDYTASFRAAGTCQFLGAICNFAVVIFQRQITID